MEDEVFHTDGQTDMKKLTVAFRNFGNASNKMRTRHKRLTARSDKLFLVCTRLTIETKILRGSAMAQAVSRRPLTAEVRPQPQAGPCGNYGAQSDTVTDFSPSTSDSRQCYSINTP